LSILTAYSVKGLLICGGLEALKEIHILGMNQLKTVHTTGYLSVIQNYAIEKAGLKKRGVGDEVND